MKKKNEILSDKEIIDKLFTMQFIHLRDSTLTFVNFYDNQCKIIREQYDMLIDNEPCKLFRKSHREWENEKLQLEKKYDDTFRKYLEECKSLEELMNIQYE